MNKEQIKEHLDEIYKKLCSTVGGLNLNGYFAGGCIASLVLEETPKDYDFWFYDVTSLNAATTYLTECNIPFKETLYSLTIEVDGKTVQLVKKRLGTPEEVVNTFDFKHTLSYYVPGSNVVCDEDFVKSKKLEIHNIKHLESTVYRVKKFKSRGYLVDDDTESQLSNLCINFKFTPIGNTNTEEGYR